MKDVIIIGAVIFLLALSLGRTLYLVGKALAESDFPVSFPEWLDAIIAIIGQVVMVIGFVAYKLSGAFGCIYILKELL